MKFIIIELALPETLDEPLAADFIRALAVGNAVAAIGYGTDDLASEPAAELPQFHNPHEPRRMLVARVAGEIVGRARYETLAGDDADSAWITVQVLPEFRGIGIGIGTALADTAEAIAMTDGKAKSLVYTPIPDTDGERMPSPTGFGSISITADARFLLKRGYRLEQVERMSRLPLPVPGIGDLLAEAIVRSGTDYRLHYWINRTPQRWLADQAMLGTRMSTDAPTAGLEEPEDVWTVERVIEAGERNERSPRSRVVAAVEHILSERLVGFTALSVPLQVHRPVEQYATLVLREHRGHRLGMLLKVANLEHLARERPGHPSVITFNAEENSHMLDVNVAVGFAPMAIESAWRKDLEGHGNRPRGTAARRRRQPHVRGM